MLNNSVSACFSPEPLLKALKKHLKEIDKPRGKRKVSRQKIEDKQSVDNTLAKDSKAVENPFKQKEMHIYLPSI